jgi:hypothetical protein
VDRNLERRRGKNKIHVESKEERKKERNVEMKRGRNERR